MTTCAIASQKGGVGKTTLTINLSYALAKRGWRVVVVDADPQGGVGYSLSPKVRGCAGFYDVIGGSAKIDDVILSTRLPELKIMPSGSLEAYFNLPDQDIVTSKVAALLDDLKEDADIVLIDTPAGLGGITLDMLKVAQWALLPQLAEPLAARSLPQAMETLVRLRKEGHAVKLAGVLLTMTQEDNPASSAVVREFREMLPGSLMIPHTVPRNAHFLTATEKGVPLALLRRNPPPEAIILDAIAAELELRFSLSREPSRNEPTQLMD